MMTLLAVLSLPVWGSSTTTTLTRTPPCYVADWGDPDGTLITVATPAGERTAAVRARAQAALPDRRGLSDTVSDPVSGAGGDSGPWTGVSPDYLRAVARAESGFNSLARAPGSSAAGRFQFVDQTWLLTLRHYGASLGLRREAGLVRIAGDGRAVVVDPAVRTDLLALRYDPRVSTALAIALTLENARALGGALGRPPTQTELYAAHLLGAGQALVLLSANRYLPSYPAAAIFPVAARSNPRLFYTGGTPRSVHDLLAVLSRRIAFNPSEPPSRPDRPDSAALASAGASGRDADELVNARTESASY